MKKGMIIVLIAVSAMVFATGCVQSNAEGEAKLQELQTENMELKGRIQELEAMVAELEAVEEGTVEEVVKEEVKEEVKQEVKKEAEPKKTEPAKPAASKGERVK